MRRALLVVGASVAVFLSALWAVFWMVTRGVPRVFGAAASVAWSVFVVAWVLVALAIFARVAGVVV